MKSIIGCPKCQNFDSSMQAFCEKCGWIFSYYSDIPDDNVIRELEKQLEGIRAAGAQTEMIASETISLLKKIKDITPLHRSLKDTFAIQKENKDKIEKLKKSLDNDIDRLKDLTNLEFQVKELNVKKNKLEALIPENGTAIDCLPAVTFRCIYFEKECELEIMVVAVHDIGIRVIEDFSLGVVFAQKTIHHYLEADMIIPTIIIPEFEHINIGEKTRIQLKYLPPNHLKYSHTIHLFHRTISKFSIDHE